VVVEELRKLALRSKAKTAILRGTDFRLTNDPYRGDCCRVPWRRSVKMGVTRLKKPAGRDLDGRSSRDAVDRGYRSPYLGPNDERYGSGMADSYILTQNEKKLSHIALILPCSSR